MRLVGAVLAEQDEEWIDQRRYLGLDVVRQCRAALLTDDDKDNQGVNLLPAPDDGAR